MTIGAAQQFFLGASKATGGGAAGYQIERSLRFNSSDSGFLSRTPAVAGNRQTWTWAGWVKRSSFSSSDEVLLSARTDASNRFLFSFNSDGTSQKLSVYINNAGSATEATTAALFRDPSAWYHVLLAVDTTQATPANQIKIYINDVQQTLSGSFPAQNYNTQINNTVGQYIGTRDTFNSSFFNGYLAECFLIDGQQLTPSSFTEVSATTGQLIPKTYTGTFGTNGFWLKFSDNSAATAAALGNDYSGNNNDWTPNNLSVTAGAGNDSLVDTPTSYGTDTGVGGSVRGNYCTWNPLNLSGVSLSNGNLQALATSTDGQVYGTFKMPYDKIYFELTSITNGPGMVIGVAGNPPVTVGGSGRFRVFDGNASGNIIGDNWATLSSLGAGWAANDIIGIAYDGPSGSIKFYKNGSLVYTDTTINTTLDWFPWIHLNSSVSAACHLNWGQRAFAYPVSGFKALCDTNLPAPVVAKPNTLMDVALYTGNGSTQTISGLNFSSAGQTGLVWIKSRSSGTWHNLTDAVRGVNKSLFSNSTDAETAETDIVTALSSTGFTLGADANADGTNISGASYAAWCWASPTNTSTNTAGSITSQVRANVSAGFSVVTFTGNATAGATVGHGLGVAPEFLISKSRSDTGGWLVYHKSIGNTKYLALNSTIAEQTSSDAWNDTTPSSTVFTLGGSGAQPSGVTRVAYCFAPVVGYSNGFSYTGNGDSSGPFVYLGFRPRFIIQKRTDSAGSWLMIDTARDPVNVARNELFANSSAAEYDNTSLIDVLSNGFKIRATFANMNASGGSFIGYAFAENPFQYARAR